MKSFGYGPAVRRLFAALMILGAALLLSACGGSDGGRLDDALEPEMPMTEVTETTMTELGAWNAPTAGSLDVSDANGVLRAHYDSAGTGQITAEMPVQPMFTGTATWSGMWSGRVELSSDPLTTLGLQALDVGADSFENLGGGALVTAILEGDGVMAELTYQDLGLDDIGLTELTSDPAPVNDGRFEPVRAYSHTFEFQIADPSDPTAPPTTTTTTASGDFAGAAAFGGAAAEGVVGYVGGRIDIAYGPAQINLGELQSVFFGTRDQN